MRLRAVVLKEEQSTRAQNRKMRLRVNFEIEFEQRLNEVMEKEAEEIDKCFDAENGYEFTEYNLPLVQQEFKVRCCGVGFDLSGGSMIVVVVELVLLQMLAIGHSNINNNNNSNNDDDDDDDDDSSSSSSSRSTARPSLPLDVDTNTS